MVSIKTVINDARDIGEIVRDGKNIVNEVEQIFDGGRLGPGFNIQKFKSVVNQNRGVARNNFFLVEIPQPRGFTNSPKAHSSGILGAIESVISTVKKVIDTVDYVLTGTHSDDVLAFFCKAAPLPGVGILMEGSSRYGVGPIIRTPYGNVVNDAMLQFYVDNKNVIRKWFRKWTKIILNPDFSERMTNTSSINGALPYQHGYRDDYTVDIRITMFDPEGNVVTKVVLVDAFPNYIGDVMMDWNDKNSLMILPVSISYVDWYEEGIDN
jgi:hypothetical protein